MKLLAELKKRVTAMGPLRRAWFTTFNLDIEFVETFVLPATIGAEPPRNRLEFEQLQQELTEKNIDFRLFSDPRFIDTNRVKRTCIPVHSIRPERLSERFSERSLFHPKVIYLEDYDGRRIIGAGSANLTLSGWGRNLEAFTFREIESLVNYREVRRFFDHLWDAADIRDTVPRLTERRKFSKEIEDWRFVHSMQGKSFASQLLTGCSNKDLVVWSPYLPRDLATFIGKLHAAAAVEGIKVHLVPDRLHGKYLRTEWSSGLSDMTANGQLTFYDNPVARDPKSELCHAKIWKIGETIAVGSWNFTGPGSNALCDDKGKWSAENNVEAGLIIEDGHDWRHAHGEALDLGPDDCAPKELLNEEDLVVAPLPPFDLHVSFDWHTQAYTFGGEWLGPGAREAFSVCLPGIQAPLPLKWKKTGEPMQPMPLTVDDSALVRDRTYRVAHKEREIHRGLVSEVNVESRRAMSFSTLRDLLEALIHGDDPKSLTNLPLRGPDDSDTFPDDSPTQLEAGAEFLDREISEHSSISYFRLFKSMHDYGLKIAKAEKLEQLEKQVFVSPDCLLELVDKASDAMDRQVRPVFNWFLANEVLRLCQTAHGLRRKLVRGAKLREPGYTPVPKSRWDRLTISEPKLPAGVSNEYVAMVRSQSGYV